MYAVRLIIVVLLILAVLAAYNPHMQEKLNATWDTIRPVVVDLMDHLYAAVRTLIAGTDSHNRTNDPGAPGGNFDRIVTMTKGFSL